MISTKELSDRRDNHGALQRPLEIYGVTPAPAPAYFAGDDAARAEHARFNATLQVGHFLMAIRAAGLAAGHMSGFDHAGLDAEIVPDGRHAELLVVNIGKPGDHPWFDRRPRLDYEQEVRFI